MNNYHQKTAVVLLIVAAFLYACSGTVEKDDFFVDTDVGTSRNLVVLLPTVGGDGSFYESQGFIQEMRKRGGEGHYKILDVKPSLYLNSELIELLKTEVIDPAKTDGYETIWLVGTSLGGHGALLYLSKYPEDIYATVVLAPFLADPMTTSSIEDEGGLEKMDDCPGIAWDYACNMLVLIKDYLSIPGNERRLALGYGTEDGFARQNRLLADLMPPDLVFTVPGGGHDWETWKKLWIQVLDHIEAKMAEQKGR
jgi:pimeloyl-ACP methyl ester carboxylesterase